MSCSLNAQLHLPATAGQCILTVRPEHHKVRGANMKTLLLNAVLAIVVAVSGVAIVEAAAPDPVIGTWQLNVSKSTFTSGPALKSQVRTYTQSGPTISLVMKTVSAEGKEGTSQTSYQLDGKDYPVTGDATSDARAYSKVNDNTLNFTIKKGGKVTATGRIVVAADLKTRTVTSWSRDSKGKRITIRAIYNKAS